MANPNDCWVHQEAISEAEARGTQAGHAQASSEAKAKLDELQATLEARQAELQVGIKLSVFPMSTQAKHGPSPSEDPACVRVQTLPQPSSDLRDSGTNALRLLELVGYGTRIDA